MFKFNHFRSLLVTALLFGLQPCYALHPLDGLGMHHVVRAEDWPIMPTVYNEFELRSFDFFDYNPTVTD